MNTVPIRPPLANGKPVTVQHDFLNATADGEKLFSVRGGIPLSDAFEQLSLLLAQGQSVVDEVCVSVSAGEIPNAPHAASQLLEFTYALVQSMHGGLIEFERR